MNFSKFHQAGATTPTIVSRPYQYSQGSQTSSAGSSAPSRRSSVHGVPFSHTSVASVKTEPLSKTQFRKGSIGSVNTQSGKGALSHFADERSKSGNPKHAPMGRRASDGMTRSKQSKDAYNGEKSNIKREGFKANSGKKPSEAGSVASRGRLSSQGSAPISGDSHRRDSAAKHMLECDEELETVYLQQVRSNKTRRASSLWSRAID
eukprot:gb/GECG01016600.1/.p1 GENE.gb/GECG01016600.1/~~gb/GECG01016600.1/.p1  ORF type:complete len:206 (+),score=24.69 gb/GECG01016600.1/:1-618(+)